MTATTRDPAGTAADGAAAPRAPRRWGRWTAAVLAAMLLITILSTAPIWQRILRDGAGQLPVVGATAIILADDWFTPSVVEVPAGTTVRFTWDDGDTPHDILFSDGITAPLQTVGTFERTFDEVADVTFRCTLHPGMDGRVVVTG
jgi:plastocyanin